MFDEKACKKSRIIKLIFRKHNFKSTILKKLRQIDMQGFKWNLKFNEMSIESFKIRDAFCCGRNTIRMHFCATKFNFSYEIENNNL